MCKIDNEDYYSEYKWVKDLYRKVGKARKAVADRKMIKDQTIRIRDLKTTKSRALSQRTTPWPIKVLNCYSVIMRSDPIII